ncbi:MAG: hypothetical protein RI907_2237 [Pseudomonadota bacterium]|jgi:hypothetical protein
MTPAAALTNRALLPTRPAFGPVTQSRLRRLACVYLVVAALGTALAHAPVADAWRITGLGLLFPGAGFLAHTEACLSTGLSHVGMALGASGLFAAALGLWWATGNVLAPPLAWLGTALWAGLGHPGPLAPGAGLVAHQGAALAALATAALISLAWPWWRAHTRARRARDNHYLRHVAPHVAPHAAASGATPATSSTCLPEMDATHLQRLRFALDRALQPVEAFQGFEHRDAFQTAALRYQVNFLGYALAMTQARYTPACRGHMHQAQARLIDKQRQHRVWSYWQLESLWGHLRRNPDPVPHDNIMYTGFVALQMALYRASTGDAQASRPGAFTLQHPNGQRFVHDHHTLTRHLDAAFAGAAFGLVPCEPNWVYPLCNAMSACALLAHDAQHQQHTWADRHAARFRHQLDAEFLNDWGQLVPCRSSLTGLPFPALGGAMPQALPCFFLNAVAPDVAQRQWLLLRRELFDAHGHFRRQAFWPIDTGNYGWSRASAYTATALAARELGDDDVYHHCLDALAQECPATTHAGAVHRERASVWSHAVELMALAATRDGFRQLVSAPPALSGPWIERVRYPDVQVASAHALGCGSLQAVLHGAEGLHTRVVLGGLQAGKLYRVKGATVTHVVAGRLGRAHLTVQLQGRTPISLTPAERAQP